MTYLVPGIGYGGDVFYSKKPEDWTCYLGEGVFWSSFNKTGSGFLIFSGNVSLTFLLFLFIVRSRPGYGNVSITGPRFLFFVSVNISLALVVLVSYYDGHPVRRFFVARLIGGYVKSIHPF